ncbi:MAG: PEP-CTERM sorting domain-containing protein [Syntrophales bacterium]
MKKSVLNVFIFLFLIFTGNVIAAPIPVEVISSSFHAWGDYDVDYFIGVSPDPPYLLYGNASDSYNNAGTTPQSGNISFYYDPYDEAYASSSAHLFTASASTDARDESSHANARAQVDATFRPLNNFNTLDFSWSNSGSRWYLVSGSLVDLTDNVVIWNVLAGMWILAGTPPGGVEDFKAEYGFAAVVPINYAFESDHVYSMDLFAWSNANWDGTTVSFGFPDLVTAPEPTTMLLLGLGLVGLAGLRRKFKQ